jgi:hypothetical protein
MASPFKKIRGKQITDNEITGVHLYVTGSTAGGGQVPSYDAGSGGFKWISLSADTIQSVNQISGLTVTNSTGPNVLLKVNTDNQTIFIDTSNNLHLGDPANSNLITGTSFGFSNNVIIYGNLTVNGTATTVNSETVTIADNFILLNSNFTAGTPTQDAGIEISRGSEPNVFIRWNEVNDYFEISNPSTGLTPTYSAILTTSSISSGPAASPDNTVVITQGTGINSDQLYLSVNEANFANIPNSALTNSTISVVAGSGLGGGGTVALGGSITLSALTQTDIYVTGGTVTLTATTSSNNASIGLLYNTGVAPGTYTLPYRDTFTTGSTYNNTTKLVTFVKNDGTTYSTDLSTLDSNDTYVTGGTVTVSGTSANPNGTISLQYSNGATGYSLPFVNIFTTGGTFNGGSLLSFTRNDGSIYSVSLSALSQTEIYVTGGTTNGASVGSNIASVGLLYNQAIAPGTYTVPYRDTFTTGGTVNNGSLTLTNNSGGTVLISGGIIQSVTAQAGLTATTTNGVVTIGIGTAQVTNAMLANSGFTVFNDGVVTASTFVTLGQSMNVGLKDRSVKEVKFLVTGTTATAGQYLSYDAGSGGFAWVTIPAGSVPVVPQKGLAVTATTVGNASSTAVAISTTPSNDGYVGISINGVWYEVGNGVLTKDCYFSVDGGVTARTIAAITSGDILYWNGTNSGFNLDANDRIDLYYNA